MTGCQEFQIMYDASCDHLCNSSEIFICRSVPLHWFIQYQQENRFTKVCTSKQLPSVTV